eukprot:1739797-Pleurochrysis_carterae.AAC.1
MHRGARKRTLGRTHPHPSTRARNVRADLEFEQGAALFERVTDLLQSFVKRLTYRASCTVTGLAFVSQCKMITMLDSCGKHQEERERAHRRCSKGEVQHAQRNVPGYVTMCKGRRIALERPKR